MSDRSVSKRKQEKRWYTVMAPEQFDRAELGETPADEPEQLYDRTIETTLGELQGDASENNTKLTFRITDLGSDAAYTEFVEHELTRDYLRSLVRRGSSKVESFETVLTSDDHRVQIQPVAFTTKKADHSQERAIRKTMSRIVRETAREHTFDDLIEGIVEGRLSSTIYAEAKTVYPLRRVEIQKLTLEARPEEVAAEEETAVDVDEEDVEVESEE
ncbi:30S ribosomal protein S3ae [Halosegnis marinus]|uniref:Small ribosomal subunit protein eS1 n=1 Tax=Halosegnis marinus TaxID=3034023 RepID=A0ABD5ZRF8_9EURY|nr:30S ribosomal protein S3ae [Halosegnis sp. DT85]